MSRNYHNVVSRYNIYFNGKESFKRGIKKIDRAYKDDYSEILHVFTFSNINFTSLATTDMDRAITKASKVITLHSITAKPDFKGKELSDREQAFYDREEYNNWVHPSYLMMGKARFYKHDYFLALKTFKYVNENAPESDIRFESMIWIARIYNEQSEYREAIKLLQFLDEDPDFPKGLRFDLSATYADHYLKQEAFKQAIPHLEQALSHAAGKKNKTRITYILAQACEKTGEMQNAYRNYKKCVNMNPPYEMAFNARINQAESFDVTRENVDEIKKILRKMLRDEKNTEYQDQIYYAYGQISLKEQNKSEAIDYFKKSAGISISNPKQKAVSYLSIADLHFIDNQYAPAQAYYDSAVRFLNNQYPGYEIIAAKSRSLNRLVENINTVQREDSLLRIAGLDDNQRTAFIDELIRDAREAERINLENQREGTYNPSSYYESERQIRQELSRTGKWYFYNPSVLSFGRAEFKSRWGDRVLEDNWRRANKSLSEMNIDQIIAGENGVQDSVPEVNMKDQFSREYYLKNLPLTASQVTVSNKKIENAQFNTGMVYFEELKDYERSREAFEILINRFPKSSHLLSSYYYLYNIGNKTGNTALAQKYRILIISEFPESDFAKILSDPDFRRKRYAQEMQIFRIYESVYNLYLSGNYKVVIAQCDSAVQQYPNHELKPKFQLLRAYAIGRISRDVREFKTALEKIVNDASGGEEKQKAAELIAYFRDENPDIKAEDQQKESLEIYKERPDEPHVVVIHTPISGMDFNQIIFNIINFNLDHYPQSEFSTSRKGWDGSSSLTTVLGTGNAKAAKDYLNALLLDEAIISELSKGNYSAFIISESNLILLKEQKSIPVYLRFYEKYYLNKNKSGN